MSVRGRALVRRAWWRGRHLRRPNHLDLGHPSKHGLGRSVLGLSGVTLIEVLVALTVLAVAGAALASVQLGALRSGRAARVGHVAASALAQELLFHRVTSAGITGDCTAVHLQHGWGCQVSASCPDSGLDCALWVIQVTVSTPQGHQFSGVTARFQPPAGAP